MGKELLALRDVSKYYTSGQSVVMGLNSINLTFCAGEFVAITGESGSGKSTLAHVLGGILPYESGELLLEGKPTSHYDSGDWERYRRDNISFISQNYGILPGSSVLSNVVSALRLSGMEKDEAGAEAESILRKVELWELRKRRATKLSSGQKQRLSIARALAKPAPILLADEPTGNLDSENSAKVIALLAEAAKERLVLLITHDFDEAQDCATRRIVLQDGRVTMDAKLREPNPAPEREKAAAPEKKRELSGYVAGVQLRARPVWCTIMALFFALTAFAVFAFLGTFIVNLDDTNTRIYDGSAFPNGDPRRIVVTREDGEEMTEEDFAALLAVDHVDCLEPYGYITDISYFYRDDVDVFYHYNRVGGDMSDVKAISRDVTLEGNGLFLKTVPLMAEDTGFLTAGRLPETMYEVVAAGEESLIGSRFPVYIKDNKNWNRNSYLLFTVEVVGVTNQGSHLYFSGELGRTLTNYVQRDRRFDYINGTQGVVLLPYDYESMIDTRLLQPVDGVTYDLPDYYGYSELELSYHEVELKHYTMGEDGELVKNEDGTYKTESFFTIEYDFLCSKQMMGMSSSYRQIGAGMEVSGPDALGYHPSTYLNSFTVCQEFFDAVVGNRHGNQTSVFITDFAYADRVLENIRTLGYIAVSPYANGTTIQNESLAAERMQTLEVCLLALAAVVVLQIVVLRAMFSVETESYALLANLGLRRRAAGRSTLWQVLAFTLIGEILGVAAILLCGQLGVERIVTLLQHLPAPYAVLTWAVHVALSLIAAVWIASALGRQVYPATGTRADLDLNGADEEVEA